MSCVEVRPGHEAFAARQQRDAAPELEQRRRDAIGRRCRIRRAVCTDVEASDDDVRDVMRRNLDVSETDESNAALKVMVRSTNLGWATS
jgi:hypothetical protein